MGDDLSSLLLDRVHGALSDAGVRHGRLVWGKPNLNLNASDGQDVFVKVTRDDAPGDRLAAELVGAAWARAHGVRAPEPLLERTITIVDADGVDRTVTVWRRVVLCTPPSLRDQVDALVDLAAATPAAAPPAAAPLDLGFFMDRIETRLAGRTDSVSLAVADTAREMFDLAAPRLAALPARWIHGDLHMLNTAWAVDGRPVALDWESHVSGPAEFEAAPILRTAFVHADQHPYDQKVAVAQHAARRLLAEYADLDMGLVAALVRFRSASNASHLLVHGHKPQILATDLGLMTDPLSWLPDAPLVQPSAA